MVNAVSGICFVVTVLFVLCFQDSRKEAVSEENVSTSDKDALEDVSQKKKVHFVVRFAKVSSFKVTPSVNFLFGKRYNWNLFCSNRFIYFMFSGFL